MEASAALGTGAPGAGAGGTTGGAGGAGAGASGLVQSTLGANGWAIVRDICNMFFILILLVIAFATILRVEGYDVKRMLPKLIIMAVLINFSKTICGLIIDAAQLIMNTFISVFGTVGQQDMVQMMGLDQLIKFGQSNKLVNSSQIFGAYVFALIYIIIAAVVMIVLLAVLVVRIVMIWIYVVLSPLAYLLATFPQGQRYASQWWDDFTKNVIIGPVLAFFLWLSFVTLGNGKSGADILGMSIDTGNDTSGLTASMSTNALMKFAISIGMLMGGLIISQQMGGQLGKIAGAGMSRIQSGGNFLKKQTVGRATRGGQGSGSRRWSHGFGDGKDGRPDSGLGHPGSGRTSRRSAWLGRRCGWSCPPRARQRQGFCRKAV